jgi:hypothetical protein
VPNPIPDLPHSGDEGNSRNGNGTRRADLDGGAGVNGTNNPDLTGRPRRPGSPPLPAPCVLVPWLPPARITSHSHRAVRGVAFGGRFDAVIDATPRGAGSRGGDRRDLWSISSSDRELRSIPTGTLPLPETVPPSSRAFRHSVLSDMAGGYGQPLKYSVYFGQ